MTEYCLQAFGRGTINTPLTVQRQAKGATIASPRPLNKQQNRAWYAPGPQDMFLTLVLLELRTLGSLVKAVSLDVPLFQ